MSYGIEIITFHDIPHINLDGLRGWERKTKSRENSGPVGRYYQGSPNITGKLRFFVDLNENPIYAISYTRRGGEGFAPGYNKREETKERKCRKMTTNPYRV